MTTKELNRDIKRLLNTYKALNELKMDNDTYFKSIELSIKPELKRLYYADQEMKYMTKDSILILLRLNVRFRVIPFHQFGLFINL